MKKHDLYFKFLAQETTNKLEKKNSVNKITVKQTDKNISQITFDYKQKKSSVLYPYENKNNLVFRLPTYTDYIYNVQYQERKIPVFDFGYTDKYLIDTFTASDNSENKTDKPCFAWDYIYIYLYPDFYCEYNDTYLRMYLYSDTDYIGQEVKTYEWKYQGKKRKEYTRQETLPINDENIRSVAIMATKSALDCMYGNKAQGTEKMYQSLMDDKASANKAIYLLDDINSISDNVCKVVTHTKKLLDGKYIPIIPWTEIKNSINGIKVDELLDAVTDISTNNNYLALFGSAYEGIYDYLANNPNCENVLECIPTARNTVQRWIDNHRNFAVKTYSYQVPQKDDDGNTVFENDENMLNQANFYSGKNSTDFIGNVEQDIMLAWYIDELVSYDKENVRDLDRTILQALILNPDMTRAQIADYLGIEKKVLNSAIKRLQRIQQKYSIIPNYNSDFHIFKK